MSRKPLCLACNAVGLLHCSDPEHCGEVLWPDELYQELRAENEKLKEMLRLMQKDKDFMQHSLREAQKTIEEFKTPYTLNKEEKA